MGVFCSDFGEAFIQGKGKLLISNFLLKLVLKLKRTLNGVWVLVWENKVELQLLNAEWKLDMNSLLWDMYVFLSYLVVQCNIKPCSRSCNGRKLSVQTCGATHGVPLQFFKLYSYKGTTKFLHLHGLMFYVLFNVILWVHNLNFIYLCSAGRFFA